MLYARPGDRQDGVGIHRRESGIEDLEIDSGERFPEHDLEDASESESAVGHALGGRAPQDENPIRVRGLFVDEEKGIEFPRDFAREKPPGEAEVVDGRPPAVQVPGDHRGGIESVSGDPQSAFDQSQEDQGHQDHDRETGGPEAESAALGSGLIVFFAVGQRGILSSGA